MTDPRDAAAPGWRTEGEARSEPTKLGPIVAQPSDDRRSDARWRDQPCPADSVPWRDHERTWPPTSDYLTGRATLPTSPEPDGRPQRKRQPTLRGLRRGGAWAVAHLAALGIPVELTKPAADRLVRRERTRTRRERWADEAGWSA